MTAGPAARLSVVVCTYTARRWPLFREAVRAVSAQLRAGDQLLVVVDHDPALSARAAAELPGVTVLDSRYPAGLSGARNTGVEAAAGEVVVFLDDDAVPEDGWLERYRGWFADPAVAAVGGAVAPRWEGGRAPRWFPEELGWVVGCDYRGLPGHGEPIRNPIGASMAVRRSVFARVGGFSTGLGRVGTRPVGGEETDLCIRARQADAGIRIVRDAHSRVRHFVPADRQTLRYLLRRCWHEGRSKAVLAGRVGPGDGLSSERAYLTRVVLPGLLRGLGRVVVDPAAPARSAVLAAGTALTALGYAAGRVRTGPRHRLNTERLRRSGHARVSQ